MQVSHAPALSESFRLSPHACLLLIILTIAMEPLYNEVLGITNDFLCPSNMVKYMKKNLVKRNLVIANKVASPLALPSLY